MQTRKRPHKIQQVVQQYHTRHDVKNLWTVAAFGLVILVETGWISVIFYLVTSYNVFVKTHFSCTSSMCLILFTAFTVIRNYADSHSDTKFVLSPCILYSLSSLCLTYCSAIVFFDCPCLMAASICQPRVSAG